MSITWADYQRALQIVKEQEAFMAQGVRKAHELFLAAEGEEARLEAVKLEDQYKTELERAGLVRRVLEQAPTAFSRANRQSRKKTKGRNR